MTEREKEIRIAMACLTCKLSDCRSFSTQCQLKKVRKEIKDIERKEKKKI